MRTHCRSQGKPTHLEKIAEKRLPETWVLFCFLSIITAFALVGLSASVANAQNATAPGGQAETISETATPASGPADVSAPETATAAPAVQAPKEEKDQIRPKTLIGDKEIAGIREWLKNPVVGISIGAQNKKYASLTQDDVDKLDKQWRAERKEADQPLIAAILSNPLSSYLTQIQAASGGLYTEIFVMDNRGLNVGQSSITSDFWQGDEAKFQKTFPNGAEAVFVDDPEFNDDGKTWRAQVNLTITDPDKKPIGAITVEYNLTELARRR